MSADILAGLNAVDELPKAKRGRQANQYDELMEAIIEADTGQWYELSETFNNVQASTRINKAYGDQGIKASARRVEGSPDDAPEYKVFVSFVGVDVEDEAAG